MPATRPTGAELRQIATTLRTAANQIAYARTMAEPLDAMTTANLDDLAKMVGDIRLLASGLDTDARSADRRDDGLDQ